MMRRGLATTLWFAPATFVAALAFVAALTFDARAAAPDVGSEAQRNAGKPLYDKYCAQCHGATGAGDGPAAVHLLPAPRNLTSGKFKIRTTPNGALPTHADVRNIIRNGMPYTSMPAWPTFSDEELTNLAYYVTTFSAAFQDPENGPTPVTLAPAPSADDQTIERGQKAYVDAGCVRCHGELGRGDGPSAPTLKDDWGVPIRAADLTQRWTFRGGGTPEDVFRTLSTGLNGTPMPSYLEAVPDAQRWDLTRFIDSLSPAEPAYANLLTAKHVEGPIDPAQIDALFAEAPVARFPIVGQVTEPVRSFHPPATSVLVQAVYDTETIAFLVRWNDMSAERTGKNGPDLVVPPEEELEPAAADATPDAAASGDVWGEEAESAPAPAAAAPADDIWGEEGGEAAPAAAASEFSDAVALQFPAALSGGARKPYFLFGDGQEAVDLWFFDLARSEPRQFAGKGSAAVTPSDAGEIAGTAQYDKGEWKVLFTRPLRSTSGVSFQQGQFVPLAFSVWDGFSRERGNRRGITVWYHVYMQPEIVPSPVGGMVKTAIAVLVLELIAIAWVRRRFGRKPAHVATHVTEPARGTH